MSRNTRNTRDCASTSSENVATGAGVVVDVERLDNLVEKAVSAATNVIRDEFLKLIDDLSDRVDASENRLTSLEQRVDSAKIDDLKDDIQAVREESRDFARSMNDNEQQSRKRNIRIKGLAIKPGEDCTQVVLVFCRSVIHVSISDDDIEYAYVVPVKKQTNIVSTAETDLKETVPSQSAPAQSGDRVIVRFYSQQLRDEIIKRRRILKGTRQTIVEDLTVLNMATLNRLRKHASIEKCWTWNGRLYALTKNGHTLLVKPFQSVSECLVIS